MEAFKAGDTSGQQNPVPSVQEQVVYLRAGGGLQDKVTKDAWRQGEDREAEEPPSISLVTTSSCVLFSLSGPFFRWFVGFGSPRGPRRVNPSSGGLDHTFHESQLSDGELHLLSEAGWPPQKRKKGKKKTAQPEPGHIITASEIMTLFTYAHTHNR